MEEYYAQLHICLKLFGKISSLSSGRSGRNCSSIKNRGAASLNFALPWISAQYQVPSYFGPNRFPCICREAFLIMKKDYLTNILRNSFRRKKQVISSPSMSTKSNAIHNM